MQVIAEVPFEEWVKWEKHYIKKYKDEGCDLTNMTEGGEYGGLGGKEHPNYGKHLSSATRQKIRLSKLGPKNPMYGKRFVRSAETRLRIKNGLNASKKLFLSRKSAAFREKISTAQSRPVLLLVVSNLKNLRVAAEHLGLSKSTVNVARRNKRQVGKSLPQRYWVVYAEDLEQFRLQMKGAQGMRCGPKARLDIAA
jgi:hypothetical protein